MNFKLILCKVLFLVLALIVVSLMDGSLIIGMFGYMLGELSMLALLGKEKYLEFYKLNSK